MRYSRELIDWKHKIRRLSLIRKNKQYFKNDKQKKHETADEDQRETGWFSHQISLIPCNFRVQMFEINYKVECLPVI